MKDTDHDYADMDGATLVRLGLSKYEAQAYVGLLKNPTATGYAISNDTGIPQSKVYETMRRLEKRGYVIRTAEDPARYAVISPDELLGRMDAEVQRRLGDARAELETLLRDTPATETMLTHIDTGWDAVLARAVGVIGCAQESVYLSGHAEQLQLLAEVIEAADERGVYFDILSFGAFDLTLRRGGAVRHTVTKGVIYRHHQNRHLAVAADSERAMFALAFGGEEWSGLSIDGVHLAALVKEYVRHDLYVQSIYNEFAEPLEQRFGTGLQRLVANHGTPSPAPDAVGDDHQPTKSA